MLTMKTLRLIVLITILLCMASCSSTRRNRASYISLNVKAFERIIQKQNVMLVDVRTPQEHQKGAIEGTELNLDVRSATFFSDYSSLPKDKTIALYCKSGGRSKQVAGVLAGNGYKVVELKVGYDGWVKHHNKSQQ